MKRERDEKLVSPYSERGGRDGRLLKLPPGEGRWETGESEGSFPGKSRKFFLLFSSASKIAKREEEGGKVAWRLPLSSQPFQLWEDLVPYMHSLQTENRVHQGMDV